MAISKEKAEYIARRTNDVISDIFKKMAFLNAIMSTEDYENIMKSDNPIIKEIAENSNLPYDFLDYLDKLPESF